MASTAICRHCGGSGEIIYETKKLFGLYTSQETVPCLVCHGSGKISVPNECLDCQGLGYYGAKKELCPRCEGRGRILPVSDFEGKPIEPGLFITTFCFKCYRETTQEVLSPPEKRNVPTPFADGHLKSVLERMRVRIQCHRCGNEESTIIE